MNKIIDLEKYNRKKMFQEYDESNKRIIFGLLELISNESIHESLYPRTAFNAFREITEASFEILDNESKHVVIKDLNNLLTNFIEFLKNERKEI